MQANLLDVIAVYNNPVRWTSRKKLQDVFEQHMLTSGVRLTTVECAYGDRPFELAPNPHINRIQVMAKTWLWLKENLINIGVAHLQHDWKYVGWIDADIEFRKGSSWASEAVHALQHYDVIQPWQHCYDLGPHDEHLETHTSFCSLYRNGKPVMMPHKAPYVFGHPGYAWCATRHAIESLGGLLEIGILGAGDHHMAGGLVGLADRSMPGGISPGYKRFVMQWQQRSSVHINRNIGFIPGTIEHSWHGRKEDRKYVDRWKVLVDNKYDPDTDIKYNSSRVLELAGNKTKLAFDIDAYFRSRSEDTNSIG